MAISLNTKKFNLVLDSSQIHEYLTCPLKWYYSYKENLQLDTREPIAPDKGTLIHSILDKYYAHRWEYKSSKFEALGSAVILFKANKETLKLFPTDTKFELENFLCDRSSQYVNRWVNDDFNVEEIQTSPTEIGFSNLIYEDDEKRFILEGRIDLICKINNEFCWVDHKTQDRKSDLYKYKTQFKTYALATGFKYGIINYFGLQQKYEEGKTFRRDFISFPPEMIKEWKKKVRQIFYEIYFNLTSNDHKLTFYQNRNEAACSGPFDSNPCQFTRICEEYNWDFKERIKEMKYLKKEPWSPWNLEEKNVIK